MIQVSTFIWESAIRKMAEAFKEELVDSNFDQSNLDSMIKEVTTTGELIIQFSSELFQLPSMEMIHGGVMYLSDLLIPSIDDSTAASTEGVKRQLQKSAAEKIPVLQVRILPGADSDPADLGFTWNVTMRENNKEMKVQVYYDFPEKVSAHPDPDRLEIRFNDPNLFISKNFKTIGPKEQILVEVIPP